jgi:RNA recognition motif-containing protein
MTTPATYVDALIALSDEPRLTCDDAIRACSRVRPSPNHQSAKSPRGTGTNLYVGGLPDSVGDNDLLKRFQVFGPVLSAKVMLHIHTGRSRGIGFVKFEDHESAAAAIQALHRTMFNGQRIMVRFADTRADFVPGDKTTKIFVRNLPFDITAAQLRRYFVQFGAVTECTLHLDTAGFKAGGSGVRTRMAYISFAQVEHAEEAAITVHGKKPFPTCEAAVMAKLAESDSKRMERRHRQRDHDAKCSPFTDSGCSPVLDSPSSGGENETPSSVYGGSNMHAASQQSQARGSGKTNSSSGRPSSDSDKEKRESSESDGADCASPTNESETRVARSQRHLSAQRRRSSPTTMARRKDSPPAAPMVIPIVPVVGATANNANNTATGLSAPHAVLYSQLAPLQQPAPSLALPPTTTAAMYAPQLPAAMSGPPLMYGSGFAMPAPVPSAYSTPMMPWGAPPPSSAPYMHGVYMPNVMNTLLPGTMPPMATMSGYAMPTLYPNVQAPVGSYPPVSSLYTPNPYASAMPSAVGYPPYVTANGMPRVNAYAAATAAAGYYTLPF